MTGYIIGYDGSRYELPPFTAWKIIRTANGEADAFEVKMQYDEALVDMAEKAVRFYAAEAGETVFSGIVDEYDISVSGKSQSVILNGRGYAAALMDNEAEAKTYLNCTVKDILRAHAEPYGIEAGKTDEMARLKNFAVKNGWSEWRVITEFCRWAGDIVPRFSAGGKLILSKDCDGTAIIGEEQGVCGVRIRGKRYGVVSHVIVKGNTNGVKTTVKNEEFISRGGLCRRIINVPNRTGYDSRRYTGEYTIEQSEKDSFLIEITFAEPFAVCAGEDVKIYLPSFGVEGDYFVRESVWWADRDGCGTKITVRRR